MSAVMREDLEEEVDIETKKSELLTALGSSLQEDLDIAIRWRLPFERIWIDDLRLIHGDQPDLGEVKGSNVVPAGQHNSQKAEYRRTHDNITRPAVRQISARIGDMMFPTNERNWDAEPSPLPDLVDPDAAVMGPDGQPMMTQGPEGPTPLTGADLAAKVKKVADQRCQRMVQHIDDSLQECKYAASGRRAINDAVAMGTGVLKGPIIKSVQKASYQSYTTPDGQRIPELRTKREEKPAVDWVDLWNFFPQPCRRISEAEHCYELHLLTKKQVKGLAKQPGFDIDQINKLLEMEPGIGSLQLGGSLVERDNIVNPGVDTLKGRFPVWEYHGPIPREVLEVVGFEFDPKDKITTIEGEVWFSQGIPVKVTMTTDEEACRLPYYVFNYEEDPTSCFGRGAAYVMRNDQIAVNQTWHATMLNAFMSAGPQIGVVPGMMEPVNGRQDLSCFGPKIWGMKHDVEDIRKVLSVFEIPNHTQALMAVYETARRNAADHTMLPNFVDGKAAEVAQTASGLAMLMNSTNIVQRLAAKSWDDEITLPLLSAFNRWFLLNGDDEEAKGDYCIIPKGESHLLVKDIQAQHIQVMTQLASDPRFAPYFDIYELLLLNVKVLNIPTTGVMRDKQTVEEEMRNAEQQPDPEALKAQAQMAQAEAAKARAEADVSAKQADQEFRMRDRELDHQEFLMTMRDRENERLLRLTLAESQLDLQADKQVSEQAIQAAKVQSQETRDAMTARLKAQEIVDKQQSLQTQVALEEPFRA